MPEPTQELPPVSPDAPGRAAGEAGRGSPPSAPRALPGWIAPAALVIALIAVAIAVWALLRPASASTTPAATSQQTADAKARACSAYTTVSTAVSLQTHADLGSDPVAVQAVAANARLAMAAGGSYLLAHLDPATPADLAAAMRSFADSLQDITMNAAAGVPNVEPAQAARMRAGEAAAGQVGNLCK
jgi:hypothetical protein